MSDFTEQQELEIIDSPEFKRFLDERQAMGNNQISLKDFLEIPGNQTRWEKHFADKANAENANTDQEQKLQDIPNLVHVLTHTGFNNQVIADNLAGQLQSPDLDDKQRAILEAVYKAYTTPNHEGLTTLNDLVNDTRDVEIAEGVARTFGFESDQEWPVTRKHIAEYVPVQEPQTHLEEREVPNMLMVVTDNREAGANHTTAELISQLESINASEHNLDAARLKRMALAIKQSYKELSNQDVLDSFASDDFQTFYTNVQNMPRQERDRLQESAGFAGFETRINGEDNTFARDRLLALYMLSNARLNPSNDFSLNNIVQNEADIAIGDYIAKNVYGYDDPINPTSNGVREQYFTRRKAIEVVGAPQIREPQTHLEEREVPNMLMVVTDNREAGANHTTAELLSRLESINASEHNLDAARLKRMALAIKQSYKELSNQDVLDSFASDDFQTFYTNVQNMPRQERDRLQESAGFAGFETRINGEDNTFARDRLLALYMLSNARLNPSNDFSLNNIVQNEADIAIGDYIAKNVYGYDDPVNPTSNGVREQYFTRRKAIEVVGAPQTDTPIDNNDRPIVIDEPPMDDAPGGRDEGDDNHEGTGEQGGNEDNPTPPVPPVHEDPIEDNGFRRERSDNSDKNEEKLDKIKVVVLYEMGVINSDVMQAALKNPEKAMEAIAKRDMLKESQQQEFGTRVSEKLLSLDNAYTEVKDADGNVVKDENGNAVRIEVTFNDLPPQMLADLYSYVKGKQENITDNTPDEEKQKITRDFNKVAERIDDITNQYYSGTAMPIALQAYNYDTETNIADIYDGYTNMFEVRRPDVDQQRQVVIDSCQKKLNEEIEQYDDVYGLSSVKEGDASRLSDNADKLFKRMENMSLSPELISQLGNLKFLDENGQEIPQIDADGKIFPNSELQTLVDFAKNNARIEHIGDENVSQDALSDKELQDDIDSRFYAVLRAAADEKDIFKTLEETQRNFQDDINTAALMAQLNDPSRPIKITPAEFETIKQDQVNQTMACINRIDKKVGANGNSYLLPKLHEPIKKYDARASERFSIADPGKPTVKSWLKTFGLTTATSVGLKAVAWGGAKLAAWGATRTTGATSTFLGNIGMSQVAGLAAVGLTGFAMYKNIKNFKANNPGVSGWKAFTTAPYASQMLASGLGCAAGVCLMTNNYPAAAICGGAALMVLGISEYRNARKLGLSKWDSFKRSAHKLSAVAAGAFTGNWLSQQFGMTPDSIKAGEKLEDAQPGKEYHNYSQEEHAHGDLRQGAAENHPNDPHTEGSRYSEYMERDWTESSYAQNPQEIHATMQSNINNGIQGHSQFFTLGENGEEISNADILEYKLYQLNLLAQNGDVATVNGTPVSEVFSVTDVDGNVTTYQDLYHNLQQPGYQMTTSDLELLGKIEDGVGGQLGDGVNDMGKISIFGEIANKDGQVLSYVDKMDAGYDIVRTDGHEAVYAPDEIIKGENPSSVAYIGWVEKAKKKTLQLAGAFADKINPFKRKKKDAVKDLTPPVPPQQEPRQQAEPQPQQQAESQPQPQQQPEPQPQPKTALNDMLDKEYQIVHGIKPDDKERARYQQLIQREWQQESAAPENMEAYMQQRMDKFETMLGTAKEPSAESYQGMSDKYKDDIAQARQRMWQLPQGENGTADMTLTGFRQHMASCLSNDGELRASVSGRQIAPTKGSVINKRQGGYTL